MKNLRSIPEAASPKTPRLALALIVLSMALLGCDAARTRQPIGSRPAALADLRLEGTWRDTDGRSYFLRIADSNSGLLEMATVETNLAGFAMHRTEVRIHRENQTLFANLRPLSPEPESDYLFGRLTVNDGTLVLETAPSQAIQKLANEGLLDIEIQPRTLSINDHEATLIVTNGFDRLARLLAGPEGGRHLDTGHPIVLMRQKSGLD